jgi:small-conductance mechanosensitive channel
MKNTQAEQHQEKTLVTQANRNQMQERTIQHRAGQTMAWNRSVCPAHLNDSEVRELRAQLEASQALVQQLWESKQQLEEANRGQGEVIQNMQKSVFRNLVDARRRCQPWAQA